MEQNMSDGKKTFRREQFTDFPWSDASLSRHIVFVGLLSKTTTRQKLSLYFSSFGRVAWLELFPPTLGDKYAYAHLLFDELPAVDKLFASGSHRIDGAAVRVRMWRTPTDISHGEAQLNKRKVFVKNISPRTSSRRLLEYFRRFGDVETIEPGPRSRGTCSAIAHVIFSTPECAVSCLNASHERIDGFKIKCKHFVPVTSDLEDGMKQPPSPQGSDGSQLTKEQYTSLIHKCKKSGLLRPKQRPHDNCERKFKEPSARGEEGSTAHKPRSITSLEGRCNNTRAAQKALKSANSSPVQQAAAGQIASSSFSRPLDASRDQLLTTSTQDSIESPPHELLVTCSMWRPVYVNYYLVEGYI